MSYKDLKNKTVLITGCRGGIGSALVESFKSAGSDLILLSRNFDGFDIKDKNKVLCLKFDIRDKEGIEKWLLEYENKGGSVDVIVNNAGVIDNLPLLEVEDRGWDKIMDVNLKSTFFLSKIFAKHMIRKGIKGSIVNASSFASKMPSVNCGVYAISKSGVSMMTKIMASELAPYGIRVNAYSPGVVETNMTKEAIKKNGDKMKSDIAMGRFGKPEEIAEAVLFLVSDKSSYITGVDLEITGGKFITQNPSAAYKKYD